MMQHAKITWGQDGLISGISVFTKGVEVFNSNECLAEEASIVMDHRGAHYLFLKIPIVDFETVRDDNEKEDKANGFS